MAEKFREQGVVLSNGQIGTGIFDLKLKTDKIAAAAKPGQFVSIYSNDKSRLLPRPISICGADSETGELRLTFRVAGKGTEEFSRLAAGEKVDLVGPLGNGFPLERAFATDDSRNCADRDGAAESVGVKGRRVFLIGGGIGIPPMVQLAKTLTERAQAAGDTAASAGSPETFQASAGSQAAGANAVGFQAAPFITSVLGFRDELFLVDDLKPYGDVVIATEDGSCGTKGNVLDAIREKNLKADVIYACGPTPMLRALKKYAEETGTECWLSLEEKMACGIGACLSCVCRSTEVDGHSKVKNKRVCTEGPVFRSTDIEL